MQKTWNRGLEGGGRKVDDEHRLQLDLVDALEHLVRQGSDPAAARRTIEQLADFSSAHFRSEELLMDLYRYEGRDAHQLEHRALTERLDGIRDQLAGSDPSRALEAIGACRSALVEHIRDADWEFARSERAMEYVRNL